MGIIVKYTVCGEKRNRYMAELLEWNRFNCAQWINRHLLNNFELTRSNLWFILWSADKGKPIEAKK